MRRIAQDLLDLFGFPQKEGALFLGQVVRRRGRGRVYHFHNRLHEMTILGRIDKDQSEDEVC